MNSTPSLRALRPLPMCAAVSAIRDTERPISLPRDFPGLRNKN
ncbi:hypothetical protein [Achromobacter insolitus]|nr:hypothetical protein [Achromobacter insolitus]